MSQTTPLVDGPMVTQGDIENGLHTVGVQAGDVVLVHTSMKAFGWVCGGAMAVINALKAVVTETGTVVMPAFSADVSDPLHWVSPPVPKVWWEDIRATMPAYDAALTPTIGLGKTPEVFRADPSVKRSGHPQLSFAAWGAAAEDIIANHGLDDPLGNGSPLAKLYDADARILFLGTGFGTCTAFHLGEARSGVRPTITQGSPAMVDGERQWVTFTQPDYDEDPFAGLGVDFEESYTIVRTKIGGAHVRLFSLREAVDFAEQAFVSATA